MTGKRGRSVRLTGGWADRAVTDDAFDAALCDADPDSIALCASVVLAMAAAGRSHESIRRTRAGVVMWRHSDRYAAVVAEMTEEHEQWLRQ